jgi:hypothetical protein
LQAEREVRRLADDLVFVGSTNNATGDDETGGDPYAHLQRLIVEQYRTGGIDDCQTGANRSFSVRFVGHRSAEIHQDAVTHVTRDKSTEIFRGRGNPCMVLRHHLS